MMVTIYHGHVLDALKRLPEGGVQCVVTSPPYWGLRDYGLPPRVWGGDPACGHEWNQIDRVRKGSTNGRPDLGSTLVSVGASKTLAPGVNNTVGETRQYRIDSSSFCLHCSAWRGSLGLEPTPDLFVQHLVEVFREVKRVLRDDGTVWLNLGDSYCTIPHGPKTKNAPQSFGGGGSIGRGQERSGPVTASGGGHANRQPLPGLKHKDLVGIPWRTAFALQADGWYLRSDIIWAKGWSFCPDRAGNVMPESVEDRPARGHEYIFLLTKNATYFYDHVAVKEPAKDWGTRDRTNFRGGGTTDPLLKHGGLTNANSAATGRNLRSVWAINTTPYKGAHFATFPPMLPEVCIKAGTSEKGACATCGAPWERLMERTKHPDRDMEAQRRVEAEKTGRTDGHVSGPSGQEDLVKTVGWAPTCPCGAPPPPPTPCVVLDPFFGSGTTGLVAAQLGRSAIGIELNLEYVRLAKKRLEGVPVEVITLRTPVA